MCLGEGEVAAIGPQLLPINLCRAIIDACAQEHGWRPCWAFDGKKNIFAAEMFDRERNVFEVNMGAQDRPRSFEVHVRLASTINMSSIEDYVRRDEFVPVPREVLQCLEVTLTQITPPLKCDVRCVCDRQRRELERGILRVDRYSLMTSDLTES